jgi:type I restriction enzyme S subunit
MSWRDVQLGDGINVKHGFAFKGEHFASSGEYLVLTPGNFLEKGGFRVRDGKERFYHADFPEDYLLVENDLIVAMTEQGEGLLGSAARIPAQGKYLHNQRLGLVQVTDPHLLDKRFLYWVFNSAEVRAQIRATATGVKVTSLYTSLLAAQSVQCPHRFSRNVNILQAQPDCLDAGFAVALASEESAEARYLTQYFVQSRLGWGHFVVHR